MKALFTRPKILTYLVAIIVLLLFTGFPFVDALKDLVMKPPLPLVRVNTEAMRQLMQQQKAAWEKRLREPGGSPRMSPATIRISDRALISVNHPWTNTSVINATATMNEIQRRLFSDNAVMDFDVLYFNSADNNSAVGFFLDPFWNRMVYTKRTENWIYALGELQGTPLCTPRAMTVDISPNNALYVADTENGRFLKLQYMSGGIGGDGSYSFTVPGIVHPVDICLPCSNVGLGDGIWVADDWNGKLVEFTRPTALQVLHTVESYTIGGQTYPLNRPRSITADNGLPNMVIQRIAFIDGERNAFVVCDPSSISGTMITALSSTEFTQPGSRLTASGVDLTQNWWVADPGLGKVHFFDYVGGSYLASYNPPVPVNNISSSPSYFDEHGDLLQPLYIYTAEPWSNTNGLRAYLPGADVLGVVDMQIEETETLFRFPFVLTNACQVNTKIVRASDHGLVQSINTGYGYAGSRTDEVAKGPLPYGTYKFQIEVLPMYNSDYEGNQQGWLVERSPEFSHGPVPPAPQNILATGYPGNIKLTWAPISGAGYRVTRDGELLGNTGGASYWDGSVAAGEIHTYTVRAYIGTREGPVSDPVTAQATHLQSVSSTALTSNSQRKMAAIKGSGSDPDKLFITYESNGEVFVTMSTNQGGTWSMESRASEGWGTASAPSIATWISDDRVDKDVYCAYRELLNGYWEIWMKPFIENLNYPEFQWGTARFLGSVTDQVDTRPVISRTFTRDLNEVRNERLIVAWDDADGFVVADILKDENGWGLPNSEQVVGYHRPSLSTNSLDGLYWHPMIGLTYDDNKDIYLSYADSPLGYGLQVPASIAPHSYGSQIAGECLQDLAGGWTGSFHIVWEAVHSEVQQTDGGVTWGEGDASSQRKKVMYQQFDNRIQSFTTAHEFVNGKSGSFYRPTVTYLANDDVVMTWDDGTNTYKAVYHANAWTITEAYCNTIAPHVMTHGTNGLLSSTKISGISPSGPPYQVKLGSICAPTSDQDDGVEVIASEEAAAEPPLSDSHRSDSTSFFSVRLETAKLKLMDGSIVPLIFTPTPDTLRLHSGNAWQRLTTLPITLPSGIDSVLLDGSAALSARGRFSGNNMDKGLRLSFELIDAETGQIIRRIGTERGFSRDTTHVLRIRERLNSLARRKIIVRPNINWTGRGTQRTKYTLVHVHTLYVDSAATSLSQLAKATEPESMLPTVFALHPNYPNPFNPSTQLKFDLPVGGNVSLVVYDVLGREITELVSGYREAGYLSATWNASDRASGVYFVRFNVTDAEGKVKYSKVNKLLLMK